MQDIQPTARKIYTLNATTVQSSNIISNTRHGSENNEETIKKMNKKPTNRLDQAKRRATQLENICRHSVRH